MAVADIRYERLNYVALNVSDLGRALDFYTKIAGLEFVPGGLAGAALLRCNYSHHDVLLIENALPGLKRISWRMESAESLVALKAHLASIGIPTEAVSAAEAEALGFSEGVRATEPTTGATFEFCLGALARAEFSSTHTKIARLGHIVLGSPVPDKTVDFLLNDLNFRISDQIEGAVTFMRCFPNSLHHSLGVSNAQKSGLHHVNFMVSDIDDIGRAIYRMKRETIPVVFGPGRHPPSESIFFYFLDPDGMTLEYSFGMEEFPEIAPRASRTLPFAIESIDYWGGAPDPRMGRTGEIERIGS
jgi:2,3-dihydroxy-p-cumate/2,3-dihydroxybenzoate 3,4-dioxygenase